MSVGPFWCYYGGKWRAAPRYPAPHFRTIVEPFAGAAGYSCRYPGHQVRLYDVDEHVVGTWRYLLRTSSAEIASLPDVPEGGTVDDLEVCQEARWLIGWWCNYPAAQPCKSPSKRVLESAAARARGETSGVSLSWTEARERIARDVDGIRHWTIEQRPWWDVPDIEGTWFVDPPYSTPAGRYYRHSDIDFAALGAWCQARRGQVMVCEQAGADWLPFHPFGHVKGSSKADGADRLNLEVIWTKGPGTQVGLFADEEAA